MKCSTCGRPLSHRLEGRCMACRYEERQRDTICRKAHITEADKVICKGCGKEFVPTYRRNQKYCTAGCREKCYTRRMHPKIKAVSTEQRFLKPGIVPPTEGWNSGVMQVNALPKGGAAKLKCDPAKLPYRGKPSTYRAPVQETGTREFMMTFELAEKRRESILRGCRRGREEDDGMARSI